MTTFYICRHGQTVNNKHGRLSGWLDTPLTGLGIENAAASAAKLRGVDFDGIISSDLGRAFVTAYLISRHIGFKADIHRVPALREVNYGDYANLDIAQVAALGFDIDITNPSGETLAEMQDRVLACVADIAQARPDNTVLLVAHDGTINALHASFLGQDVVSVAAAHENAHDFVAKFIYDNSVVRSFEEIVG